MKNIAILGSTGSIGTQTLEVVAANPTRLRVVALAAHKNVELLLKQIQQFRPVLAVLADKQAALELGKKYQGPTKILGGEDGLKAVATCSEADTVLGAMVGYAGLQPTLAAINAGKNIALANKETLVAAGSIVMNAIKEKGVQLTPVDSEHSAIFQSLQGSKHSEVKRLLITASGGAFRDKTLKELENVTVEQCLHHPNWTMGKKVTVDSATLANKGLEIMEAHWLFAMDYDKIKPLIHPQSIVHSLVEYKDGAVIAQLGVPDMRLPIQYALSYPDRWDVNFGRLDLVKAAQLTFKEPDYKIFRALKLAVDCGKAGGTMPCVFNAANEVAVESFLRGKIKFLGIAQLIEEVLNRASSVATPTVEDIAQADRETRTRAEEILKKLF
ncbi:MAG: 1-deoxy-D-xylulose-5-phosphate reductoisomerase [Acidaminococcaceae bacterium]|jgi:1-deoxy-D-xylulose-5-phosphate reductoisomerase|nr:1-deoxy-D-xylulose-5-phosphate reductoisomerase [Acidaminococcaceae bacterium]MCI2109784.1 1-deoxy-D-xylulose-5-phosphate reductoisomerase [Acidaminococcaceae bacterium]